MRRHPLALASVLGIVALFAASPAKADCDRAGLACSVGTAKLSGRVTSKLGTPIDSGWLGDTVKVRTSFTIDPVAGDPLVRVDLPSGALVEATWTEAGFLDLKPITQPGQSGSVDVHYTLTPSVSIDALGLTINRSAEELVNKIPGASFHYDAKATAPLQPWGFGGAQVIPAAPALKDSTIFAIAFSDLSFDPNLMTGTLSVQAAASPVFEYRTMQVLLDSGTVSTNDGTTRIPVSDVDAIDVRAQVTGQIGVAGSLAVRPHVKADTIKNKPTFGLLEYSFDAATVDIGGSTTPVSFDSATIHIPLPNVKVPTPLGFGSVDGGSSAVKKATIKNTGELGASLTFESSDPQFVVDRSPVKVDAKGSYDLPITFKAVSGSPASATITVRSNDPDSPVQTFKVGGNGADIGETSDDKKDASGGGCTAAPRSTASSSLLGLALGALALAATRRRKR